MCMPIAQFVATCLQNTLSWSTRQEGHTHWNNLETNYRWGSFGKEQSCPGFLLPQCLVNDCWQEMDVVKEFLESSTINGLSYISTSEVMSRKGYLWSGNIVSYITQTGYGKLFWTVVVAFGFTGALVLINHSYSAWQESPIATMISTHPLATLDFPTVTICPSKDSNTALYPDLMRADNSSLTEDDRESLRSSIREILKISALDFANNMQAATNPKNLEATYQGFQFF